MLTIPQTKIGLYKQYPTNQNNINSKNNKQIITNKPISNSYYPSIYFTRSFNINKENISPFKKETLDKIDNIYENYKNSLNETSMEDIKNAVDNIEKNTKFSRKKILKGMQQITQFGNINSLSIVGKNLNEKNIGMIASNDKVYFNDLIQNKDSLKILNNNFGLNSSMDYLFAKKYLQVMNFRNKYCAIFLDDNKITQFEKLAKEKNPAFEEFKKDKNMKFFVLSGFNNGITFINREKNLEKETIKFLNKNEDIDKQTLDRVKKLGLKPFVIENNQKATEESIYNQLRPEQMTKKELKAIINANVITGVLNEKNQVDAKHSVTQYLENTLDVYSPERLSKSIKNLHKKIVEFNKKQGKSDEDIIYYIPKSGKSYDLMNYQYQQVNNIPFEQFVPGNKLAKESPIKENKTIVVLDDCSISGASLNNTLRTLYDDLDDKPNNYKNTNIIIAPICCSKTAYYSLNSTIHSSGRTLKDKVIADSLLKDWNKDIKNEECYDLIESVGDSLFGLERQKEMPCVIFPYMCPDNNTEIAANIGLYHSLIQKTNHFDNPFWLSLNIKSYNDSVGKVANITEDLVKNEKE